MSTSAQASRHPGYVYFLVHIPKTGGQSLRDHFIQHLSLHETFIHLGGHGRRDARDLGLDPFEERPASARRRARVILGHHVSRHTAALVHPHRPRLVTFLRDPASQTISHYNFDMAQQRKAGRAIAPFDAWYDARPRNFQTWWILRRFLEIDVEVPINGVRALEAVVQTLQQFHLVADSKHLSTAVMPILDDLGVPREFPARNRSGAEHARIIDLTDSLRTRIEAENPIDAALYRMLGTGELRGQEREASAMRAH